MVEYCPELDIDTIPLVFIGIVVARIRWNMICLFYPSDAYEYEFNEDEWDCIFVEFGTIFNQALKAVGDALNAKVGNNDYSQSPSIGDEIKIKLEGTRKCISCKVLEIEGYKVCVAIAGEEKINVVLRQCVSSLSLVAHPY